MLIFTLSSFRFCFQILLRTASAAFRLLFILTGVLSMLNDPNINSPANVDASVEWRDRRANYVERCKKSPSILSFPLFYSLLVAPLLFCFPVVCSSGGSNFALPSTPLCTPISPLSKGSWINRSSRLMMNFVAASPIPTRT